MYSKVGTEDIAPMDAFHWVKPEVKGQIPMKRNEHTCVAVDSLIFVFGGFAEQGTLNDLSIYDTSVHSWTRAATTGNGPSTRYGNSFVLVGRKIYLFGGMVGGNTFVFGAVPDGILARLFNIKSGGDVEAIEEPENDTFTLDVDTLCWEELIVKGSIPSKRCGHGSWVTGSSSPSSATTTSGSGSSSSNNKISSNNNSVNAAATMFIFGGWGEHATRLNDMHQFHIESRTWSEVTCAGRKPSARCGFSISHVGENVFLFGGWGQDGRALGDFHAFNIRQSSWSPIKLKGAAPPGRTGHSAVVVDTKVYIFGGDAADNFYNEIHILDTDKLSWTKADSTGAQPSGISRHAACLVGSDMYIVGGWDRNFFYNDVWFVRTELGSRRELSRCWAFKTVVVGDSGVGKTCIIRRLADDTFDQDIASTIGIDFRIVPIEVENDVVKLQLWDTAGQERFHTITSNYYRGSHGIVLIYDITSQQSFDHLYKWMKDIEKTMGKEQFVGLVVGNKADLALKRQVDANIGKRFAMDNNMLFIETSAKDAVNIERAFTMLCSDVINNAHDRLGLDNEQRGPAGMSIAGLGINSRNTIANIQDRWDALSTNRTSKPQQRSCCSGEKKQVYEF